MMSKKLKILIGLLVLLISMQFIKPDRTTPDYDMNGSFDKMNNTDAMAVDLLKHGCYDCHSYEREYPWYADIAPVSYWIQGHINGATHKLNFSEWSSYTEKQKAHKLEEVVEEIESGDMPPKSFKWMHPEADWTDEQKSLVLDYIKNRQI